MYAIWPTFNKKAKIYSVFLYPVYTAQYINNYLVRLDIKIICPL